MPFLDWFPVVSQLKACTQLLTGDFEGAKRTQENFIKECPGVSQLTSTVQVIAGDSEGAIETQKRCLGTINNVANGLPVFGHVKGAIHLACGDEKGGKQALNSATRTTLVLSSGVAAGFASGGLAAIPAGIAAGSAYDLADSTISEKPKGLVAALDNAINNPNAGNIFDAVAGVASDGLTGYAGGKISTKLANHVKMNSLEAARDAKNAQLNDALFSDKPSTSGQVQSLSNQINLLTEKISNLQQNAPQYLYDPKTNQIVVKYPINARSNVPYMAQGQNNNQQERTNSESAARRIIQDNGILADMYIGEAMENASPETKNECINKYMNNEIREPFLVKPNRKILDKEKQKELMDKLNEPDKHIDNNLLDQLNFPFWLPLKMPEEFNYTSAVLFNVPGEGILHILLRHSHQFIKYMNPNSVLEELVKKLDNSEISDQLLNIRNSWYLSTTYEKIADLIIKLEQIKNNNYERFVGLFEYIFLIYKLFARKDFGLLPDTQPTS